jgi:hypothetical protein
MPGMQETLRPRILIARPARQFNHAPPSELAPRLRTRLADFYRAYNQSLQEYIGRELYWE